MLPAAFLDWQCSVVALEIERSFWEKATILHTEFYRPTEKTTPDRFSRHYADTASLDDEADLRISLSTQWLSEMHPTELAEALLSEFGVGS